VLGVLLYITGCFVAASVLTTIYMVCQPVRAREDLKSWRVLLHLFIVSCAIPFAYVEGLTLYAGKDLEEAVTDAYEGTLVNGPMHYFKITSFRGGEARAIVIGSDTEDWGMTDRPIISVRLVHGDEGWMAASYDVVNSMRLNKDGLIFPPYQ
jgi:hypothetical protein